MPSYRQKTNGAVWVGVQTGGTDKDYRRIFPNPMTEAQLAKLPKKTCLDCRANLRRTNKSDLCALCSHKEKKYREALKVANRMKCDPMFRGLITLRRFLDTPVKVLAENMVL